MKGSELLENIEMFPEQYMHSLTLQPHNSVVTRAEGLIKRK